jgi:hypothetical protein
MVRTGSLRPKARGLAKHGSPPGWLEENYPSGCDFVTLAPVSGGSITKCTQNTAMSFVTQGMADQCACLFIV